MEVKGTIQAIHPTNVVSDKFSKRNLWLVTEGEYPQTLEIQFIQDKCAILDKYAEGEQVEISYNLKGNKWTNPKDNATRVFNTIEGWKIGYSGAHADAIQGAKHQAHTFDDDDDTLPF